MFVVVGFDDVTLFVVDIISRADDNVYHVDHSKFHDFIAVASEYQATDCHPMSDVHFDA